MSERVARRAGNMSEKMNKKIMYRIEWLYKKTWMKLGEPTRDLSEAKKVKADLQERAESEDRIEKFRIVKVTEEEVE